MEPKALDIDRLNSVEFTHQALTFEVPPGDLLCERAMDAAARYAALRRFQVPALGPKNMHLDDFLRRGPRTLHSINVLSSEPGQSAPVLRSVVLEQGGERLALEALLHPDQFRQNQIVGLLPPGFWLGEGSGLTVKTAERSGVKVYLQALVSWRTEPGDPWLV